MNSASPLIENFDQCLPKAWLIRSLDGDVTIIEFPQTRAYSNDWIIRNDLEVIIEATYGYKTLIDICRFQWPFSDLQH